MIELTKKQSSRFLKKVEKTEHCWYWKGCIIKSGYGHLTINSKQYKAHIVSYKMFAGDVPQGLVLDHLCRQRRCVNPGHLEPVTNRENILRGISPSAIHARKTHCPKGHAYDMVTKRGTRICRQCQSIYMKKWKEARI